MCKLCMLQVDELKARSADMEDHVVLDNCLRNQTWMQQVLPLFLSLCLSVCLCLSWGSFEEVSVMEFGLNSSSSSIVMRCHAVSSWYNQYIVVGLSGSSSTQTTNVVLYSLRCCKSSLVFCQTPI